MNRILAAVLLVGVMCATAWAFTVVQSKSGFGTIRTDSAVDDANTLHAYSASTQFVASGAGVFWSTPTDDGFGVYHSYAVGPFAHNADGTVTVRGATGRTPPPVPFVLEEIAP